jgi:hypothetical protein
MCLCTDRSTPDESDYWNLLQDSEAVLNASALKYGILRHFDLTRKS